MDDAIRRPEVEYNVGDINCENLSEADQRSLVFHLLYTAESFDYQASLESIADNFNRGFGVVIPVSSDVFQEAKQIIQDRDQLDTRISALLANWRAERLGTCTKLILRLGVWQLLKKKIDPLYVLNGSIELAKCFAEKDAYKFVNGVLDELAKQEGIQIIIPQEDTTEEE